MLTQEDFERMSAEDQADLLWLFAEAATLSESNECLGVAQSVEQGVWGAKVGGSSPSAQTNREVRC